MATKIQVRRDTTANWTTYGAEVPAAGEFCYDTDANTLKIGNGVDAYRDLNVIADSDFDVTDINDNYVAVTGDNMTGDLTLGTDPNNPDITLGVDGSASFAGDVTIGTDKITLDATAGSATFASGAFSVRGSDGATIITQPTGYGALFTSRDGTITSMLSSDGQLRLGGTDPTDSATSNIFLNGVDGSATFSGTGNDNTVVIKDGGTENVQIKASGAASFNGRINNLNGFHTQNVPSTSGAFSLNDINGNPISYILGDGSATFAGSVTAEAASGSGSLNLRQTEGNSFSIGLIDNGLFFYDNTAASPRLTIDSSGNASFTGSLISGSSSLDIYGFATASASSGTVATIIGGNWGGGWLLDLQRSGTTVFHVDNGGNATYRNAVFQLEPDNDTHYTTTTDVDGSETRVYNGPTLDVKERLQNLISRIDAIEANEVVDDATDSSLLQLVASASARLDSLEARIAQLEADHATMMGNNNGGY